jgi:hypothetical protein
VLLDQAQIHVHLYRDQVKSGILDTLNDRFQRQLPMPAHTPDSYTAFILSKPYLAADTLHVHAIECLGENGEANGELWLKLKSGAGLASAFDAQSIEPELPLQALQQYLLLGKKLPPLVCRLLEDGPAWLKSPLETDKRHWQLPVLQTPLDVPERFAGHCYMKLVTPQHPACITLSSASQEMEQG